MGGWIAIGATDGTSYTASSRSYVGSRASGQFSIYWHSIRNFSTKLELRNFAKCAFKKQKNLVTGDIVSIYMQDQHFLLFLNAEWLGTVNLSTL
jgi:hypothetical protein